MSEQDNRIHSPELAHYMASAEDPYREIAIHAQSSGNTSEHDTAILRGKKESISAGKEYLTTQTDQLNKYDIELRLEELGDRAKGILTYESAELFAEQIGFPSGLGVVNTLTRNLTPSDKYPDLDQPFAENVIKNGSRGNSYILSKELIEYAANFPRFGKKSIIFLSDYYGLKEGDSELIDSIRNKTEDK